ncbi:similar to Saccharomyces cerevisiae YOL090W MSH2 Protein that forms heterodimers with Msh3p and Msh6p that bind to DNA mismatches to initiate the mismatch repair process [Maudiozyma saulgeensis]|uniref:DNA mismatch repair protein MSH2 n=1 Tax=Maudiozyma saulgeensis TaxID=1789683 RepID=A0A1X7R868_9SACH|nr:similar to Saccharomyces cerevisiae YOL090W MSH2 Protein that forms heterodimers with Msh3p and Msh6p that bind to DNA mismatches to initiate the mismatch repair process [Kazachstania saulgeensis]
MSATRPELKFSDVSEERGFYRKFVSLPDKPTSTVRVVDRGDYFTVVGNDAVFVAESIYHTSSVLKNCNVDQLTAKSFTEPCQYVTISSQILANLLKHCLLDIGYKVEIYDKNWKLLKNASPGNIEQVSDLLNIAINTSIVIASLKIQLNSKDGNSTLGIAFVDTTTLKIGMLDIVDNEVYSNLESFLIQLGVKECLVQDLSNIESSKNEMKKITGVIDRCDCVVTLVKSSQFQEKDVELDLAKLIDNELALSLPQKYSNLAMGACHALLNYLQLLNNQEYLGNFELTEHSLKEFMKLDASAIKALNVYTQGPVQPFGPSSASSIFNTSSKGKITSLFQLLNNCKTNAGVRLLNEWLKQPLTNIDNIHKRHDLVECMVDQLELRQILQTDFLPLIPDVRNLTKKLNKNGNLEDVLKIYQFTRRIPDISQLLQSHLDDNSDMSDDLRKLINESWVEPLTNHLEPLSKLQEMVETTVDLDAYEENNEFMIRVEFNEDLADIKTKLDDAKDKIKEIHLEAADNLGFDPDKKLKLENHHLHGWCMRLTRNDAKELRKHKEYVELSTVKAGIFFSTRELKEIAKNTFALEKEYEKQQSSLVKEIVNITVTYTPVMEKLALVLAHLDVIVSFAHISSYAPIPYVRPTMHSMDSERKTKLVGSRHPVLEMQDDLTFISNDVHLEKGSADFLIITGPNMGGKSTYIRQVGVISLLAQIGCFVPCDEADIAIVDAILCRVGAGDSQLKGVSTFMVEMLETASILKNASRNSLIIVDELGRGTSTYDGFGLAWSIAEHIAKNIGCFTLFATHFHELTTLSEELPNVKNLNVVAHIEDKENVNLDKDEITLLYRVEPGISDQSFGIHVAEVVKFPQKIIKMAKRKAVELESLKEDEVNIKKAKLSISEINEGNRELRKILKTWVADAKKEGLTDSSKLTEEVCRDKVEELIKTIIKNDQNVDHKYMNYLKELFL